MTGTGMEKKSSRCHRRIYVQLAADVEDSGCHGAAVMLAMTDDIGEP
jgi:hypothetical protein